MTTKERILTALRGGIPARIPWAPRWELWFEAVVRDGRLPAKYRGWDIFDVARDLGLGLKGIHSPLYRTELDGVEVRSDRRETAQGQETITEYRTPLGSIRSVHFVTPELAAEGVGGRTVEPLVKAAADYDVATYVVEHTRVVPMYDEMSAFVRRIGDDGLAFPNVGSAPLHRFMREWSTYEQSYYELNDRPNQVEKLVSAIEELEWAIIRVAAQAPVDMVELDGNYDYELTPPPVYRQWFLPFHQKATAMLHRAGKLVATHVDGDNKGLLELIKQSGFDVGEAWTPAPMTSVSTAEARRVWGSQMSFWGGLPTTVLSASFPEAEFDRYFARLLLEVAPGNGLVLGTGDNFPTDSSWERIDRVTRLVGEYGSLPLDVDRLRALAGQ